MSKFLFVVQISYPSGLAVGTNVSVEWHNFEIDAKNELPPVLEKQKITRNVWLFDSENGLPSLMSLTNLAQNCGLAYTAYLLQDDPVRLAKPIDTKP